MKKTIFTYYYKSTHNFSNRLFGFIVEIQIYF